MTLREQRNLAAYNSTFAIVGVSCSADSLRLTESFVLRINICGKKPAHCKSANRYQQPYPTEQP
jgi:hypothetical protein